jgi:pimeloyl-ACP methyl ester carboxylesterase
MKVILILILFPIMINAQKTQKINSNNETIILHDFNSDFKKAVILVHGLGDNYHSFQGVIDYLKLNNYRTIYFDLPGCGENINFKLAFKDYPSLLNSIIDTEISKENEITLIGHSFGGLVSLLAYQLDSSNRISRVITIEPSITDADKDFFKFVQEPPNGIGFEELKKNTDSDNGYLKTYKANLQGCNPHIMKENIESVYKFFSKNQKLIFESEKPFVYCFGKNSSQPEVRARMADYKFIKVKGFDNAEHWVHQDQPEAFLEFLKQEIK